MRIVIDMLGAIAPSSATRGVGRYTVAMAKALAGLVKNSGDELFLVLNASFPERCDQLVAEFAGLLPRANVKTVDYSDCPAAASVTDSTASRPLQELLREWYLHQFDADVVWSTDLQQGWWEPDAITSVGLTAGDELWCTTVHDVTPLLIYDQLLAGAPIHDWYFKKLEYASRSGLVVTDSEFSKRQLTRLLDVPEEKISVVPCAVDEKVFFVEDPAWRKAEGKQGPILYFGGVDIHKNLKTLLSAYAQLDRALQEKHHLVFGGTPSNQQFLLNGLRAEARALGVPMRCLEFAGRVSDSELRHMMGTCSAFVYPSVYEGFGLPPLEAMSCGAPVLAADASSIPEVVGVGENLFNPRDARQLASKLKRVLTDRVFSQKLIDDGLKRAGVFAWEASARTLLEEWRRRVGGRTSPRRSEPRYGLDKLARDLKFHQCPSVALPAVARFVAKNTLFEKRRVYVDVSAVVLNDFCTGIQRVANALAVNLAQLSNDEFESYPVFSDPTRPNFYRAVREKGKYVRQEMCPDNAVSFRDGDVFLSADLHPENIMTKESMLVQLCRRGVEVVTVVYDLIPVDLPETYPPEFSAGFARYLESVSKFTGILGISRYSTDRFMEWCREKNRCLRPDFRKSYFYLGSDILNAAPSRGLPETAEKTLEALRARPTFLAVSTIEPRKMHLQMLDAFDILWERGVQANLVFVGRDGWENGVIKTRMNAHPENGKRFHWLQGVSDEYLEKIYDAAACVIMASRCEGFGLSIVEGAQHGKPLLLRDIPVFREVAGENAFYFTGTAGEDLASAVERWLSLQRRGEVPSSKGIRGCTWRESAKDVLGFFGLRS